MMENCSYMTVEVADRDLEQEMLIVHVAEAHHAPMAELQEYCRADLDIDM